MSRDAPGARLFAAWTGAGPPAPLLLKVASLAIVAVRGWRQQTAVSANVRTDFKKFGNSHADGLLEPVDDLGTGLATT